MRGLYRMERIVDGGIDLTVSITPHALYMKYDQCVNFVLRTNRTQSTSSTSYISVWFWFQTSFCSDCEVKLLQQSQ